MCVCVCVCVCVYIYSCTTLRSLHTFVNFKKGDFKFNALVDMVRRNTIHKITRLSVSTPHPHPSLKKFQKRNLNKEKQIIEHVKKEKRKKKEMPYVYKDKYIKKSTSSKLINKEKEMDKLRTAE